MKNLNLWQVKHEQKWVSNFAFSGNLSARAEWWEENGQNLGNGLGRSLIIIISSDMSSNFHMLKRTNNVLRNPCYQC